MTIHCSDEDEPETFLERFDKVYFVHQDETYSRSITQFNNDTFFIKVIPWKSTLTPQENARIVLNIPLQ